jgi:hypothetical protein
MSKALNDEAEHLQHFRGSAFHLIALGTSAPPTSSVAACDGTPTIIKISAFTSLGNFGQIARR